ncbi:MAG TPA: hypothetical protein VNF47_23860 [Streptosporangiaceae bacterium]|nr:hypothetical protein [Streptosporangiaceae bacterium]
MRRVISGSRVISLAALVALSGATAFGAQASTRPALSPAGSTVKWTRISTNTGLGIASAGLLRTADGRLHVVWPSHDGLTYSLHYSTVVGKAKLLVTGTILRKWSAVSAYPRLVPLPGGGIRLVFTGANGVPGSRFNLSAMYTATSNSVGRFWRLAPGSMSKSKLVPLTDTAAVTRANGTPVAAWSTGGAASLSYHIGINAATPASNADQSIALGAFGDAVGPTLIRGRSGGISVAWFNGSGTASQGYWVSNIPSTGKTKAPGSGGQFLSENQPLQSVAYAARSGGGAYLAYCVPTKSLPCAHIVLWRVGAAAARTVPGSATGHASHVALVPGRFGHMWLMWYDTALNKIRVVRTNAAVTGFGSVATIPGPPNAFEINGVQGEGSAGPLDIVALAFQFNQGQSQSYWDTQLLPALRLRGSKSRVSHTVSTTITFAVTDAGDPVAGATVKFLGKALKTNLKGLVKITVPKGTPKGKYTAIALRAGFATAAFTVRVT